MSAKDDEIARLKEELARVQAQPDQEPEATQGQGQEPAQETRPAGQHAYRTDPGGEPVPAGQAGMPVKAAVPVLPKTVTNA
ncbi:MAG TPA: hypothetical protein DHU96_11075 [Actinobacteria bacterium]|nr:hypothetical protein [Actinomycetota bacterium]